MGSVMLQIRLSVGTFMNGSITAVLASGITSMSLLLIACHPRIEDPSNPNPSLNTLSVSSSIGMEKCCQTPGKKSQIKKTPQRRNTPAEGRLCPPYHGSPQAPKTSRL